MESRIVRDDGGSPWMMAHNFLPLRGRGSGNVHVTSFDADNQNRFSILGDLDFMESGKEDSTNMGTKITPMRPQQLFAPQRAGESFAHRFSLSTRI
ncbi:hypothetical protein CVS40_12946 [Lucilia cuprina]|nr:hypothetical protein CVS40_12946 [Lucilia cuprina]